MLLASLDIGPYAHIHTQAQTDNLSLISRTQMLEEENGSLHVGLCLPYACCDTHVPLQQAIQLGE